LWTGPGSLIAVLGWTIKFRGYEPFFKEISGRCIDFIEEEVKTVDTMLKGYLIQMQRMVHTTTRTDQTTRARLVPSTAKNGEEAIHRAF
jgi:hypothetical protein